MGMAASQVRLLQLTSRKNDIGRELQKLSMQKTSMAKETSAATKKYRDAMNTKCYKWSNNSGVNYIDLSYSALMKPSPANQYTPYLLTNSSGKVVVDTQYYEYAKMISPSGASGGDWTSNRTAILSALTGVPAETIDNATATSEAKDAANAKVEEIQSLLDAKNSNETTRKDNTLTKFANMIGNIPGKVNFNHFGSNQTATINSQDELRTLLDAMANSMSSHLLPEDAKSFTEACDNYYDAASGFVNDPNNSIPSLKKNTLKVAEMMDFIMSSYKDIVDKRGTTNTAYTEDSKGHPKYITREVNSDGWQKWNKEKTELDTQLAAAKQEANAATDTDNQVLSSDQERMIQYYDQLFQAIADNGWEYNSQISDNDYLNNMLQNNEYYITTMTAQEDDDGKSYFEYDSSLASNFDKIFAVTDDDAIEEAQVQYEYEKSIINEKESRIDTRMDNLKTEQSAVTKMMESIEQVKNDNIERTMNITA